MWILGALSVYFLCRLVGVPKFRVRTVVLARTMPRLLESQDLQWAGTRFHIEGAPTFASMRMDRDDAYFGGQDQFRLNAVVPCGCCIRPRRELWYGHVRSVPFALGVGEVPDGSGTAKYHLQSGMIQAMFVTAAAAYAMGDRLSIGGGVIYVRSSWTATLHTEALTSLNDTMVNQGLEPGYDDSMIENPDYGAELSLSQLSDDRVSFNVGIQVKPLDSLTLSLAYTHGVSVNNRGSGEIRMGATSIRCAWASWC